MLYLIGAVVLVMWAIFVGAVCFCLGWYRGQRLRDGGKREAGGVFRPS